LTLVHVVLRSSLLGQGPEAFIVSSFHATGKLANFNKKSNNSKAAKLQKFATTHDVIRIKHFELIFIGLHLWGFLRAALKNASCLT
jgi:hypothetical protein